MTRPDTVARALGTLGMRVLIVDGDEFARRAVEELLTLPELALQVCAEPPTPRGAQWKRERAPYGRRR